MLQCQLHCIHLSPGSGCQLRMLKEPTTSDVSIVWAYVAIDRVTAALIESHGEDDEMQVHKKVIVRQMDCCRILIQICGQRIKSFWLQVQV